MQSFKKILHVVNGQNEGPIVGNATTVMATQFTYVCQ